ncbi:MFS transporter [Streptomyces sp. KR80]|uniref:MFS transporter n=1 Tax=Streptomyces sp. KR80 TaxID=3457426 RepID=UPI003FCEEF84
MPSLNKIRTPLSPVAPRTGARRSAEPVPPNPVPNQLRRALTAFFALDGFLFAGWVVRIPAIKQQTGASTGDLGLALLGVSAGAVATMMLTGRLCRRFGNHPVTVAAGVLLSLSIALPPLTGSALALGLVLLVFGAAYGAINVAMNSAAVDLVAALRRPVMPSFHAAFSLGGMLGAGLGGLLAGHLSATRHLILLTVVGLLLTAVAGRTLLAHPPPGGTPPANAGGAPTRAVRPRGTTSPSYRWEVPPGWGSPRRSQGACPQPRARAGAERAVRRTAAPAARTAAGARRMVALFGLIALCTAYGEGALADWSALHLQQNLDAHPGVAAAGYSVFALTMTVGRLTGTVLLERLGQTRALVAGGTTAAGGMLLGALAPSVWLALLGFAVTGLGLANIFPIAIGRAGALSGPSGVAAASTLGYGGMLLGPPAIGFLADWFSLRAALTTVALLAGLAAVVAAATRNAGRTSDG